MKKKSRESKGAKEKTTAANEGGVRGEFGDVSSRALELRRRYADLRARTGQSGAAASDRIQLEALLDLIVPSFAAWCAIDVVDDHGALRRRAVAHEGCDDARDEAEHDTCVPSSLLKRAREVETVAERVLSTGESEMWPPGPGKGLPWGLVMGISVKGHPYATVSCVAASGSPGFGPLDLLVAEEVAWGIGAQFERSVLRQDARDAVRGTQRIASQLHQLIAVSITVGALRDEREILESLAGSTRRVFDADVAVISLETGPDAPLVGVANRGRSATSLDTGDPDGYPRARPGVNVPWREDEWLVAPMLEQRNVARGVVAVRRDGGAFRVEDEEVLTLLAQMASTSLGASGLSRGIERSEARWRILVETAPVGIVEVGEDGHVRWWNLTAGRILSWPVHDPLAPSEEPRFPDAAAEELAVLWQDVLSGAASSRRDLIEVEINGRRRDLASSAVLLPSDQGSSRSVLTLIDDVTDLRQLKAEVRHAQQMETRGQVASSVAHDFNNLLTLISGYAEILSKDLIDDARASEMVRDIQATASRASLLTAQLQTIGRTKSLEPVVLSPVAALQSIAEVLERIVGSDIELHWALTTKPVHVRVDAGQFEQMVLNLTINARDAMPNGGELTFAVDPKTIDSDEATRRNVDEGEYAEIVVADTGNGMDEPTLQRCFEPFFTTKGTLKGTGMGLAAARRLVEESGGAIDCQSELGEGTTFEILLPCVVDEEVPDRDAVPEVAPRGSATVLLAEDDDALRQMMVQVLERNGYLVLAAETGERALEVANDCEGTIDLLVSDVVMSEVSGPELAATLQSADSALRVLMTSGTADESVLDGLAPGTSAFLAKPFRPSQLIDQVHELLARRP